MNVRNLEEDYYFTLSELERAFGLIMPATRASSAIVAWAELFREFVHEQHVIAFPEGYKLPRLFAPAHSARPHQSASRQQENTAGDWCMRFTDITITLVAGANPVAQCRFDRLHVPYARKTIDNQERWAELLAYLRNESCDASW